MFLPMSWMSPLTVPITSLAFILATPAARCGSSTCTAASMALALITISGRNSSILPNRWPTSRIAGVSPRSMVSNGRRPAPRLASAAERACSSSPSSTLAYSSFRIFACSSTPISPCGQVAAGKTPPGACALRAPRRELAGTPWAPDDLPVDVEVEMIGEKVVQRKRDRLAIRHVVGFDQMEEGLVGADP